MNDGKGKKSLEYVGYDETNPSTNKVHGMVRICITLGNKK